MIEDYSLGSVVLLGAGASGIGVFILSLIVQFTGIENGMSYAERLAAVYAFPIFLMWLVFAASSYFTVVSAAFAVSISIGLIVGSDYLGELLSGSQTPELK